MIVILNFNAEEDRTEVVAGSCRFEVDDLRCCWWLIVELQKGGLCVCVFGGWCGGLLWLSMQLPMVVMTGRHLVWSDVREKLSKCLRY